MKRRGILITNRTELNSIVGRNTRYDQAQNNSLDDRCIITGQAGPPMVPGGYNSGYQFVQSPGWVMILIENNHIARMIPTDGRPGLPQNVRGWTGISRGHWEGNTLLVQTTNITTDLAFPGNFLSTREAEESYASERELRAELKRAPTPVESVLAEARAAHVVEGGRRRD